jgi:hypothetical protein
MSESFETPSDEPPIMSEEEGRHYAAAAIANDKVVDQDTQKLMSGGDIRAGYKIEITFDKNRTTQGPNAVMIKIYESGKFFHGGGDDMMYWCKDVNSQAPCGQPLPSSAIRGPFARCPNCLHVIDVRFLTSERLFKNTTQDLATIVEGVFHELKDNADIYVKYHRTDIRYLACERAYGEEKARALRGLMIYPLKNIIQDTANGASLVGRIRALLSA